MDYIKAYRPETNSFSSSQVLSCPYDNSKARVVLMEMADAAALKLVGKRLVTDQLVLTINYDATNLTAPEMRGKYTGEVTTDHYGRQVPKHSHGSISLGKHTSSTRIITDAVVDLYDRISNKALSIRRLSLTTNHVITEEEAAKAVSQPEQLDLFTDYEAQRKQRQRESEALKKERRMQEAVINIKQKFGKNSILRGLNFEEGATAKARNTQIGGHKA